MTDPRERLHELISSLDDSRLAEIAALLETDPDSGDDRGSTIASGTRDGDEPTGEVIDSDSHCTAAAGDVAPEPDPVEMVADFTVLAGPLRQAVGLAGRAWITYAPLALEDTLWVTATADSVEVRSRNDGHAATVTTTPVEVAVTGQIAVSKREFSDLLDALLKGRTRKQAESVEVRVEAGNDGRLMLTGRSRRVRANHVLPTPNSPSMPSMSRRWLLLNSVALKEAFRHVLPAVATWSNDEKKATRYVHFAGDGDRLTLSACDRYHFAAVSVPLARKVRTQLRTAVDPYWLREMEKHLPQGPVRLGTGTDSEWGDYITLHADNWTIWTSDVEEYRDWPVPRTGAFRSATVDGHGLTTAVQLVDDAIKATGRRGGAMRLTVAEDRLVVEDAAEVAAVEPTELAASTDMAGQNAYGILLSPSRFLRTLKPFKGEAVSVHVADDSNCVWLTTAGHRMTDTIPAAHALARLRDPAD